jgi:hypothetical protein
VIILWLVPGQPAKSVAVLDAEEAVEVVEVVSVVVVLAVVLLYSQT